MKAQLLAALFIIAVIIGGFWFYEKQVPSTSTYNVQSNAPGDRKEIGEEREVRSWERGGTTVTIYEQELLVSDEYYSGPAIEQILKAKRMNESEIVLGRYQSGKDFARTVEEVYISPLGTYVTAEILGYESRYTTTYASRTGAEVIPPESKKIPYWTHDEKKVALIQWDSGIDGTPAAFFYSSRGNLEDSVLLHKFKVLDDSLENVVQEGDLLTITMVSPEYGNTTVRTYTLNLQTGIVTSE